MTKHVHGGNIYTYKNCLDFSANCNPLGTPESVKQAVRDSLEYMKGRICTFEKSNCRI